MDIGNELKVRQSSSRRFLVSVCCWFPHLVLICFYLAFKQGNVCWWVYSFVFFLHLGYSLAWIGGVMGICCACFLSFLKPLKVFDKVFSTEGSFGFWLLGKITLSVVNAMLFPLVTIALKNITFYDICCASSL